MIHRVKKSSALLLFALSLCSWLSGSEAPYPIQFSIPEIKIVPSIPNKTKDFAFIVPGKFDTYIYTEEADYYADYQSSYYGITHIKQGWDCMRHYEILANGCIPYFIGLEKCPPNTMVFLPKELIDEAMHLPGVFCGIIDHENFNVEIYNDLLAKLLEHTRTYLTTKAMAAYVLNILNYSGEGKILFLSNDPLADYLRDLICMGMKENLGDKVVDVPKVEHIYQSYPKNVKILAGVGMSYTMIIPDAPIDRDNIEERILNKEFELVLYGSVHRGLPFHDLVKKVYPAEAIAYLCGEDGHQCEFSDYPNLFMRESDAFQERWSFRWFQNPSFSSP